MNREYFLMPRARLARIYRTEGALAPVEYWSVYDKEWCRSSWFASANRLALEAVAISAERARKEGAVL